MSNPLLDVEPGTLLIAFLVGMGIGAVINILIDHAATLFGVI